METLSQESRAWLDRIWRKTLEVPAWQPGQNLYAWNAAQKWCECQLRQLRQRGIPMVLPKPRQCQAAATPATGKAPVGAGVVINGYPIYTRSAFDKAETGLAGASLALLLFLLALASSCSTSQRATEAHTTRAEHSQPLGWHESDTVDE